MSYNTPENQTSDNYQTALNSRTELANDLYRHFLDNHYDSLLLKIKETFFIKLNDIPQTEIRVKKSFYKPERLIGLYYDPSGQEQELTNFNVKKTYKKFIQGLCGLNKMESNLTEEEKHYINYLSIAILKIFTEKHSETLSNDKTIIYYLPRDNIDSIKQVINNGIDFTIAYENIIKNKEFYPIKGRKSFIDKFIRFLFTDIYSYPLLYYDNNRDVNDDPVIQKNNEELRKIMTRYKRPIKVAVLFNPYIPQKYEGDNNPSMVLTDIKNTYKVSDDVSNIVQIDNSTNLHNKWYFLKHSVSTNNMELLPGYIYGKIYDIPIGNDLIRNFLHLAYFSDDMNISKKQMIFFDFISNENNDIFIDLANQLIREKRFSVCFDKITSMKYILQDIVDYYVPKAEREGGRERGKGFIIQKIDYITGAFNNKAFSEYMLYTLINYILYNLRTDYRIFLHFNNKVNIIPVFINVVLLTIDVLVGYLNTQRVNVNKGPYLFKYILYSVNNVFVKAQKTANSRYNINAIKQRFKIDDLPSLKTITNRSLAFTEISFSAETIDLNEVKKYEPIQTFMDTERPEFYEYTIGKQLYSKMITTMLTQNMFDLSAIKIESIRNLLNRALELKREINFTLYAFRVVTNNLSIV
jgi:hypothetical protein